MPSGFVLHTGVLDPEACPVDPTSPVPPPWDAPPSGGSTARGLARPQMDQSAPGAGGSSGGTSRTMEVGSMLAKWARNPELLPYEEVFRSEPNEAWFDLARDPDHPTQFEIATVQPGAGQAIVVFDYSVVPYGFSGISPLDYAPLPDEMISGVFGYSIRVDGQEPGQLKYRLDPLDSTIRPQQFRFQQTKVKNLADLTADDFAIAAANSYATAAGFATSLHPQTAAHYGPRVGPFTEYVVDNQVLAITGVVFRPVDVTLAFIQARISGYKGRSQIIKQLVTDLRAILR